MSDVDDELQEYATGLQQQVISECEIEGEEAFKEAVFSHLMLDALSESGEVDDAEVCIHRGTGAKGTLLQVNGWAVSQDEDTLDLIIAIYTGQVPPRTILKDEMTAAFKRLRHFAVKAFSGYHFEVEESTKVFDVAQRINELNQTISQVRLTLITDGIVKAEPPANVQQDSVTVSHHIWDIERFFRLWSSGRQRESVEIDLAQICDGTVIPCLMQPAGNPDYCTYLAIFPGSVLVKLYGRFGPRLLERNVRSFLQARGKVNSGIRKTIINQPHMFLAYNNGLSATAEAVGVIALESGAIGLRWIRDLQIVNGGQTTASLYHATKKDKADLDNIYVQVKLTVLNDASKMDEVVPRISEYANSQNKIQTADFAANDAYHRRLEELSRTIWAPAQAGTQTQTHWYYERARGQYQDDLARERTPARKKAYQATNPLEQLFSKTDLSKFVNTYAELPHVVSRGAQSSFNVFTVNLEKHIQQEGVLNHGYFERLVARAILFRSAERIMKQCGYAGYRANLVAYTIARLVHDTRGRIDLSRIWREQGTSPAVHEAIATYSKFAWDHITNPPNGGNVTQYCKKEDCWLSFLNIEIPMPNGLAKEIGALSMKDTSCDQNTSVKSTARQQIAVVSAIPVPEWLRLCAWAQDHKKLTALQRKIVSDVAIQLGYGKLPSARLADDAIAIMREAIKLGFKR